MTTHTPDPYRIPLVRALVELSAVDLLYADQYLDRAEVMLAGVCTRQQYLAARRDQESIQRLTDDLRQATERQDMMDGAELRARVLEAIRLSDRARSALAARWSAAMFATAAPMTCVASRGATRLNASPRASRSCAGNASWSEKGMRPSHDGSPNCRDGFVRDPDRYLGKPSLAFGAARNKH